METYAIGVTLIIIGAFLFFIGNSKTENTSVSAQNNSVAVGGDNSAPITNIHKGSIKIAPFSNKKNVLATIVELLGLLITLGKAISEIAR